MAQARLATLADIDTLVALIREFYAESGFDLDRAWAAKAFTSLISSPQLGRVWLLTAGERVAGHVVLTLRYTMEYGGVSGYVDDLFVRPECRRQGVAAAGMAALLEECRRRGCLSIQVEVGETNTPALALYTRYGLQAGTDGRLLLTRRLETDG